MKFRACSSEHPRSARMKNLQKNECKKTKIIPTTQCEDEVEPPTFMVNMEKSSSQNKK